MEKSIKKNYIPSRRLFDTVQMNCYISDSISSLDASMTETGGEHDEDDPLFRLNESIHQGLQEKKEETFDFDDMPDLASYTLDEQAEQQHYLQQQSQNNHSQSSSRWDSDIAQDLMPSSPRRRSFEIKRTVFTDLSSPLRRASSDTLPILPLRRWNSITSDCSDTTSSAE